MASFVLVHGAWHGGWCWSALREELTRMGHPSIAPDLPCDDVAASWADYADAVGRSLDGIEEDLVLVGHSLAGGVIPLVAAALPVQRMVFLASFPPEPERTLDETLERYAPDLSDPRALAFRESRDEDGRYVWPNFEAARYAMYHDCDRASAQYAYANLRPQAARPFEDRWPLDSWPDVPMTFIVCSEDRMGRAAPLSRVARRRFGIDPIELPGGHSPFLSRPAELARVLLDT